MTAVVDDTHAVVWYLEASVLPDMPDRMIAATALALGVPLVTRDGRMRAAPLTTVW